MATRPAARKIVLVVDDDGDIRMSLEMMLAYEGYEVWTARDGEEALARIDKEAQSGRAAEVALCDVKMPRLDGPGMLDELAKRPARPSVIMISGHGDVPTAVDALRRGAVDFLEKPLDQNRVVTSLRNALRERALAAENRGLKRALSEPWKLLGDSVAMRTLREQVARVAASEAAVLITGENGSGKEVVARQVHLSGPRAAGPFVTVNCAAIPSELIESELFGHEKGSFTGADRQRTGRFEQADGGTLFLDEIGDMGEEAQAKVLKAVEESRFQRVGGTETRRVNVRIVAATNRELSSPQSGFRQDLYYRLNVLALHLPPLRDRHGDIPLLLDWYMAELATRLKLKPRRFAPETVALLEEYSWPGNVRELRNLVERLLILAPEPTIRPVDLPPLPGAAPGRPAEAGLLAARDFLEFKARSETVFLQLKLRENLYNVSRTADVLGMQRSNLYKKIAKYGLRTQPGGEAPASDNSD